MPTKILLIDEDKSQNDFLKNNFQLEGFEILTAVDGIEGIAIFDREKPSIVILDTNLPKKDGLQVCREIRAESQKPLIFLSSKGDVFDKCLGLEMGADDYVTKPFEFKELLVRVKAVLRRSIDSEEKNETDRIVYDNLEISLKKYELIIKNEVVHVPPKEIQLLFFLASHPNHVFTRDQLLDKVWGYDYLGDSRTVDVHIKRLRDKLNKVSSEWSLETIWSIGYKFELKD